MPELAVERLFVKLKLENLLNEWLECDCKPDAKLVRPNQVFQFDHCPLGTRSILLQSFSPSVFARYELCKHKAQLDQIVSPALFYSQLRAITYRAS